MDCEDKLQREINKLHDTEAISYILFDSLVSDRFKIAKCLFDSGKITKEVLKLYKDYQLKILQGWLMGEPDLHNYLSLFSKFFI